MPNIDLNLKPNELPDSYKKPFSIILDEIPRYKEVIKSSTPAWGMGTVYPLTHLGEELEIVHNPFHNSYTGTYRTQVKSYHFSFRYPDIRILSYEFQRQISEEKSLRTRFDNLGTHMEVTHNLSGSGYDLILRQLSRFKRRIFDCIPECWHKMVLDKPIIRIFDIFGYEMDAIWVIKYKDGTYTILSNTIDSIYVNLMARYIKEHPAFNPILPTLTHIFIYPTQLYDFYKTYGHIIPQNKTEEMYLRLVTN